jgi:hypothetical protein
MKDKNKLTTKQIDTFAKTANVAELLRQQSLDKLKQATQQAVKDAQKGKRK